MNIVARFAKNIKDSAQALCRSTPNKIGLGLFIVGLISSCVFPKSSELATIIANIGVVSGAMVAATTIANALLNENDLTKISSLKWLSISGVSIVTAMLLSMISLPVIQYLSLATLLTGSILASLLFIYTSFVSPLVWATEMIKELEENAKDDNIDKDEIVQKEIEEEKELELTYYFKK